MSADDVPRLTLKWAFGLPRASSAGTQPVVVKGRMYITTAEGDIYVLDAKTGCVHWTMEAEAGIRTALTMEQRDDGGHTAYFGDQSAHVYAVDTESGKLRWKVEVDEHPHAAITGAPQLYGQRLYVPVSSREESQVGDPRYPCCQFRGSIVALDRKTGQQVWKTYTIDRPAAPTVKNSIGTQLFGPSGAAVWNTPTIDSERNTLYVGTGNNFSPPATNASDAVVALDLTTGGIRWIHQITANDIWNASCRRPDRDPAVCPDADAPDLDFPGSPILVDLADGRQLVIAGNKDGMIYALDPDRGGATVWRQRVARGGLGGGVFWGAAVDDENVYGADAYYDAANPGASGGLAAVELATGRIVWRFQERVVSSSPRATRHKRRPSLSSRSRVLRNRGRTTTGLFDEYWHGHLEVRHGARVHNHQWRQRQRWINEQRWTGRRRRDAVCEFRLLASRGDPPRQRPFGVFVRIDILNPWARSSYDGSRDPYGAPPRLIS